jgi:uncharacterized protein YukE
VSGSLIFTHENVEHAISTISLQGNSIEEQVLNPIQRIVQQITGGAWRGQEADAFVQELNTAVLPEVKSLVGALLSFSRNIRSASNTIVKADNAISETIGGLAEVFDHIYKPAR